MIEAPLAPNEKLERFFSPKGIYVKSLTRKRIAQLVEQGYDDPAKIFSLTELLCVSIEGITTQTLHRLVVELEEARYTTLPHLLYALGFPCDDTLRYALLRHHPTWYGVSWASCSSLRYVAGMNDKNSEKIKAFFSDPKLNNLVVRLRDQGVCWDKMVFPPDSQLTGKRFVLTGKLEHFSRIEAEEVILLHGGTVSDTVSSKTDYVLVGEKPGSKLTKARALGIEVIDEATWLDWADVIVR